MIRRVSRHLPLVVLEHATEGLPADDWGGRARRPARRGSVENFGG